jgi:hypothetical protein
MTQTFRITAPDGTKYEVTGPDGATEQDALAQVQAQHSAPSTEAAGHGPIGRRPEENRAMTLAKNYLGFSSEPVMNIGSSMVAAPVAGLAGLAQGAKNLIPGMEGMPAADRIQQVQAAMTYEPRTTAGKATTGALTYPFRKLGEFADYAGGAVSETTGSPAAGAAVNTAIQFAPALIAKGAGKITQRVKAAPNAAPPRVQPTISEPPEVIAAKDYVARSTSLDWNALSDAVKSRLTEIAKDADTLGKLDPAAVERQARLESLPVPIKATRGQLTRDTAQLNNEGTLAATESGRPLKAVRDAQSGAIVANLEVLKGKVRGKGAAAGTAETPEQVGLSVQDAALRAKLRLQEKKVSDLYKQAEVAGETQGTVTTRPLARLIEETPDLQHLGWVDTWLKKADIVTDQKGVATKGLRLKASLKELEDLRQAAVARAMDGGTEGYYAGKVIRAIDQATEGAGGNAYKAARAARKQQGLEFEDRGAVARLVENKSRTDRAVALEDTWRKTVLGGSIEDLNNVKRSLLTGADAPTRVAGRRAWRDIRAQTIQHITDEATKGSAPLPDGTTPVSAAGMQKAINAIGPEKLDAIFGEGTVRQINKILQATKDVRTEPPRIHPGSSTMGNVIAFLEKSLGKLPVLGDTVTGSVRAITKLHEMGQAGRDIRAAQRSPLDEGVRASGNAMRKKYNRNALEQATPSFIPAQERRRE